MNLATADRLIELNRGFYEKFGHSFSATRKRLQPGVLRILGTLQGDEAILDLGCGNGELAQELARRGHRGPYLGVDSSLTLLREAQSHALEGLRSAFLQADLTHFSLIANRLPMSERWDVVTAFAVLHHIPGGDARLELLRSVHRGLSNGGRLAISNWQFLNSEKLKERIQPWEAAGLSTEDVDPDDYLLDWRRDGAGLRYVHYFSAEELSALATQAGFSVRQSFLSDGENQKLGLYQIWVKA
ncbi:MAG: class I SAM-dependent methyltransferase [Bacteroidota bacterium]